MTDLPSRRARRRSETARPTLAVTERADSVTAAAPPAPSPGPGAAGARRRDDGTSVAGTSVVSTAGRTHIMGVLNVTPDSFSDGGRHDAHDAAVAHARHLVDTGADIVDVGGESTRPGAERVPVEVEQRRVLPVVRDLVAAGITVSVDTMNASTAARSLELGAAIVNDVSGGLADPDMTAVVAGSGARFVVVHWRGHSDVMQQKAVYDDVVEDVRREVEMRAAELIVRGVHPDQLIVDPGIGFAKHGVQNWTLLAGFERLASLGLPVLVAASRKRFLAGVGSAPDADPAERDAATAAVTLLAAERGAWGVRVHEPAPNRAVLDVWDAWRSARS